MSTFATTDTPGRLRLVQVGAGGMGKAWIEAITANPDVELVGLVDLNTDTAHAALAEKGLAGVLVGTSVSDVAAATGAHAVVNVTVPVAHHPVNVEAMLAGLPVLCEKPAAPTVAEALSLAASAEASGQMLMISQSRRYFNSLTQLKAVTGELGEIGVITTEFFKAPHFGGFREDMDHVLLVDMAIHPFDAVRHLTGQDPVSVYCEEFNPAWSWYKADAAATAIFEFSSGLRYVYSGSWCADGQETSWNGQWRVNGERGTARWDGEQAPVVDAVDAAGGKIGVPAVAAGPEQIAGSLAEFVSAIRTGKVPDGEIHANVHSLAMVEAAVLSAETGQRVRIDDVLTAAYEQALVAEKNAEVKAVLAAWGSPLGRLACRAEAISR
ncbi:Gfo/Idh/MocA family protein [Arthrobacter glacialis]|uniref:Gfo/Idh/MocA family protein n=1 Tax=Arthrobacter glacialis TaxID=1664 RepID=UPI000CD3B4E1|nr:Gfo/Idh/MocA family oxidoreductase [Arthrobacter glacialis]POH61116.1 oxidoreductase [Arthrobacter glacialis]